MKIFILILFVSLIFKNKVLAGLDVTQVKGNRVLVTFDNQELQVNRNYEILNENFEIAAKIKVIKIQKQKGLLQVISGKLEPGIKYSIQNGGMDNFEQENKAEVFIANNQPVVTNDFKKTFSIQALYLTGDGQLKFQSIAGSDIKNDLSGYSLGVDFTYWIGNIGLGADLRFSSLVFGTGSQDSSSNEFGVFTGYLMPDLNLKIFAGLYLFGSVDFDSGVSASETFGIRAGIQYFVTPQVSIMGEYRILVSEVEEIEAEIVQNTFNIGAGFHF